MVCQRRAAETMLVWHCGVTQMCGSVAFRPLLGRPRWYGSSADCNHHRHGIGISSAQTRGVADADRGGFERNAGLVAVLAAGSPPWKPGSRLKESGASQCDVGDMGIRWLSGILPRVSPTAKWVTSIFGREGHTYRAFEDRGPHCSFLRESFEHTRGSL